MKKNISKYHKRSKQAGFTLIELLVVIGIFTVITAVAFINQGQLNSSVLLTNAAYETALAVREAQVYGLGVRKNEINSADNFDGEYGVHFDVSSPDLIRKIIVYSNNPNDPTNPPQMYNSDPYLLPKEARYLYEFVNQRGNKIQALCFGDLDAAADPADRVCSPDSLFSRESMDITFKRPEPRANFFVPPTDLTGLSSGPAYIVISTIDDQNCKVVIVHKTGQIEVEGADRGHCKPL